MNRMCLAIALAAIAPAVQAQSVLHVNAASPPGGDGLAWSTAMSDLQDALDAAGSPGSPVEEIWVAAGIYHPDRSTGDPTQSFAMRDGLMVLGGFAGTETSRAQRRASVNHTVLSGDLGADHSYHVVIAYSVDAAALLDGFIVEDGDADGGGIHSQGGGIRVEESDLRISGCVFRRNAAIDGGAVYVFNAGPVFFNCVFDGNDAAGNCGGMYGFGKTASAPAAINCTFTSNRSGSKVSATALTYINLGANMLIRNCVLWNNSYTTEGFHPQQLWGNLDAAYTCANEADGWPKPPPNNPPNAIAGDPRLVDRLGPDGQAGTGDEDLRIAPGSPCIDSGDAASIPADTFDLDDDGNTTEKVRTDYADWPRLYDDPYTTDTGGGTPAYADMGAFEGPALALVPPAASLIVPEGSQASTSVKLSRPPQEDLTVALALTGDRSIGVSPTRLDFTPSNWDRTQPLNFTAAEDGDSFEGAAELLLSGGPMVPASIDAVELENDPPQGLVYVNINAVGQGTGATWADAFKSLDAALTYAKNQGGAVKEIWVAKGTYKPAGASFTLQSSLAIYGGFAGGEASKSQRDWAANKTVLSGDTNGDDQINFGNYADNKTHIIIASGVDSTAVLDGFEVRGGNAWISGGDTMRGGAMFCYSGAPSVANCTFRLNRGRVGGAIYLYSNTWQQPTFVDCAFHMNIGTLDDGGKGGAICAEGNAPSVALTRCSFTSNKAWEAGGALWVLGQVIATDCEFDSNTMVPGAGKGGSVYLNPFESACVFENCRFTNNGASDSALTGGALRLEGKGKIGFEGCAFSQNKATYGGVVDASGGDLLQLDFVDSEFSKNFAALGAARLKVLCKTNLTNCTFSENSSDGGAGVGGGNISQVTNCVFVDNTAKGAQGGLSVGSTATVSACTFIGNIAGTGGGAGAWGGALHGQDDVVVLDCVFIDNHALGDNSRGGAIHLGGSGLVVARGLFVDNSSGTDGGAVFTGSSPSHPTRIMSTFFAGNSAGNQGGAFYGGGDLVSCSFTGNSAGGQGGASYGGLHATNCSLVNNTAAMGGGFSGYQDNDLNVENCLLWGNTDNSGSGQKAQLDVGKDQSIFINYSCVQGWTGSLGGLGNHGNDPMLFDPDGPDDIIGTSDDRLWLGEGSPCIDAANNGTMPPDWLDLDADGNTAEPNPFDVDFSLRFIDDPDTSDTGVGTPPIVDMGSSEFVPHPSGIQKCYPDCDGSKELDIDDFICFQTLFGLGDLGADCDQSGELDIDDFICFQTAFGLGCP